MRLLVTSVPGLGHLHPVLPLALAAAAAGHEVRVATAEDRIAWVQRCGAVAVPAGLPIHRWHQQVVSLGLTGAELPRHLFTTIAVPPMVEDLLALIDRWRPDVLLHEEGEYGAPLAAALRRLPCVTHSWAAPARPAAGRALLDAPLRAVWERFGADGPARQVGGLYLDACPPVLQLPDLAHVGARILPVRTPAFDGPAAPAPPWLADLPRPAVYVTLGTEPTFCRPELLQRLVEAAAAVVPGVVVATGPHPPQVVTAPHAGVHVVQYVPQSQLLPHVDAVVSHGGAGTTAGALLRGTPLLVVPGPAPSQQACAQRVASAGVGLRLDWADATPEALRRAVADLVARDDLRTAARAARADLDALPPVADVVDAVAGEAGSVSPSD